jgi:hypothetical protein
MQAEVTAVDLARRSLATTAGALPYDWLVLSPGIREDWSAWQVNDAPAVAELRRRHSGAMLSAADLPALKQRLANLQGRRSVDDHSAGCPTVVRRPLRTGDVHCLVAENPEHSRPADHCRSQPAHASLPQHPARSLQGSGDPP